jgi:sortase (surface protein transpeptidase)
MKNMLTGVLPALTAVLALLLAMPLTGCADTSTRSGAPPGTEASQKQPAVVSFRSTRTYRAVAPPVQLRIPVADVDTALQRLGRAPDGTIKVPSHPDVAGWYAEGPRPGQPGPAVILGHVDSASGPAVFFHLADLQPGDAVYVDRADGSTAGFRVTGRSQIRKSRFPTDLVYGPTLEASLRLVTCAGSIDPATRHYRDNVIVFATPV